MLFHEIQFLDTDIGHSNNTIIMIATYEGKMDADPHLSATDAAGEFSE